MQNITFTIGACVTSWSTSVSYWATCDLSLADDVPKKLMSWDLDAIIAVILQLMDVLWLRC
jgi:hypothetical protein